MGELDDVRRGAPLALVFTLALAAIVALGAHHSNAFPSEKHPFGWPGPAAFENAVAMVRGDLAIAASLPALLLGALALRRHDAARDGPARLARTWATHAAMLTVAAYAGGALGGAFTFKTPFEAWLAFGTAHALLALACYSLAFLASALLRRYALPAATLLWLWFVGFHEGLTRTMLFRQMGYHALAEGRFPDWFWLAQAASPFSSYRGTLILWRPGFRDALEKASLDGATLPAWLTPGAFIALLLVVWIALPLSLALALWQARKARAPRGLARPMRAP